MVFFCWVGPFLDLAKPDWNMSKPFERTTGTRAGLEIAAEGDERDGPELPLPVATQRRRRGRRRRARRPHRFGPPAAARRRGRHRTALPQGAPRPQVTRLLSCHER